jgi:hypothetical protein
LLIAISSFGGIPNSKRFLCISYIKNYFIVKDSYFFYNLGMFERDRGQSQRPATPKDVLRARVERIEADAATSKTINERRVAKGKPPYPPVLSIGEAILAGRNVDPDLVKTYLEMREEPGIDQ